MKRILFSILIATITLIGCKKDPVPGGGNNSGSTSTTPQERCGISDITYQVLVYSFADSNGDGIGDFKGIEQRLDYLREMGVQALWLSPIHPATSYHGYDVLDYSGINEDFGTEADFQSLVNAAHNKGIKIYLDYVLNHTSREHPWFLEAKKNENSKYRDYFIFSDDPKTDIEAGKFAMIEKSGYDSGQWFPAISSDLGALKVKFTVTMAGGKPSTLTIEQVDEITNSGTQNSGVYLFYGDPGVSVQFYKVNSTTLSLSLELETPWGVLVRTSTTDWGDYKYGATAENPLLEWGKPLNLVAGSDSRDILIPGMTTTMYHSHFWTPYFADLNYGAATTAETSGAFIDVCESADKWINMGVDGFRLDAIKHIYHDASSDENPTFLKKFYDHCNATYKARGGQGNIYMVGEHYSNADEVAPYYKKFPGFFDFSFWWTLRDAIKSGTGKDFYSTIKANRDKYEQYAGNALYERTYIDATKLSNHDEDRAGSELLKSTDRMKLAAAVLLTAPGEPFIYQGEELGYCGTKANGDEYVRTPIMWNADGSNLADKYLGEKIDRSMLIPGISVPTQEASSKSVLNVYRKFGALRDTYEALVKGDFTYCSATSASSSVASWYRTYENQKLLVLHNFGSAPVNIIFTRDKLNKMIASNGSATVKGTKLTLGSYSSAVFLQ